MTKEITVEISPTGEVAIEGHGFAGSECRHATKAFEDALGNVLKRTLKGPESIAKTQRTVQLGR